MATVGELFKQKRQEKNLSLHEISEATKISSNFLAAIENDDFKKLPKGIFPKMFLRAYAKYLELDETQIIQMYYETMAAAEPEAGETMLPAEKSSSAEGRKVLGPFLTVVVILIAAVVSGYFLLQSERTETVEVPAPVIGQPDNQLVQEEQPAAGADGQSSTAQIPSPPPVDQRTPAGPATGSPEPGQPAAGPATLEIHLQARQFCWVHLAWEKQEMDFILKPGDTFRKSFQVPLALKLGNAGGIQLRLNGQAAKVLGAAGEVVTINLSPAEYQQYLSTTGENR